MHSNIRFRARLMPFAAMVALLGLFAPQVCATIRLRVTTSLPSPQPLGTPVVLTAGAQDSNSGVLNYKFEVMQPGSSAFSVMQDFSLTNSFSWTPTYSEATYQLRVTARNFSSGETSQVPLSFQVNSLLVNGQATVNPTSHPLVALFAAPTCPAGSHMRVYSLLKGSQAPAITDWRPCHSGSMNFLIAGMRANSVYLMNYQIVTGTNVTSGPATLPFTSGTIPPTLSFPATSVKIPVNSQTDPTTKILLTGNVPLPGVPPDFPVATDLNGNVVWYFRTPAQLTRPVNGGTMLLLANGRGTGTGYYGNVTTQQILQEIDLAGNTVREVTADRVSEQLQAMGADALDRFSHDAIRLSNGNTIVIGGAQRVFPAGTQGSPVPVDIMAPIVVILDRNFQVLSFWNAFDHATGGTQLDINRTAGETICTPPSVGCPPAVLPGFSSAIDWIHANSVQLLPDNNLLLSLRSQNWVIKIDYEGGTGTGTILWRLGLDGDFTMTNTTDPYPWFSGQHDAGFEDTAMQLFDVFDNGATRVTIFPGDSRGQVYSVNYTNMTVSLQLNVDLGVFAPIMGSAQLLPNGDFMFQPGLIQGKSGIFDQSTEVNASGTFTYQFQSQAPSYRSFRLVDFYHAPTT
jgi:arylsulfate sulfotransferase